jgi:hypothetical protein
VSHARRWCYQLSSVRRDGGVRAIEVDRQPLRLSAFVAERRAIEWRRNRRKFLRTNRPGTAGSLTSTRRVARRNSNKYPKNLFRIRPRRSSATCFTAEEVEFTKKWLAYIMYCHGPMVYHASWHVLHHRHDAEVAFQTTFMLLAQNLHTTPSHASYANWLRGMVNRGALKPEV